MKKWGIEELEETYPISFIGTGADINEATINGMERAAKVSGINVPEVMNRAMVNGSMEIGRHPGVVTVTFPGPVNYLERSGLLDWVKN